MASWLDTPFGVPPEQVAQAHKLGDPDHLLDAPGVHLKSRELDATGFPAMYGKLASFDESKDQAVVISKPDCLNDDLKCIWVGTIAEYQRMWRVD
jgi:hypothetical protein